MANLIILPTKGFHDEDLLNIIKILDENSFIATPQREIAIGKYGTKVIPDFSIENLLRYRLNPFSGLIIIADEGWKQLNIVEIKALLTEFYYGRKIVILISLAPLLLLDLPFMKNKIITYNFEEYPKYQKIFLQKGIKLANFPVFKDDNLITCKGRESIFSIKKYI